VSRETSYAGAHRQVRVLLANPATRSRRRVSSSPSCAHARMLALLVFSLGQPAQPASQLLSLTHKFEARAPDLAKSLVRRRDPRPPSNQRPLVFFHLRKSGGSQMRDALRDATRAHNLSSFIPCYDRVPCESYTPPRQMIHNRTATGSPRYEIMCVSLHGVKFRGLPATEHFQRRRRSMLVRLSLGRSSLIAGAAQSVGTCDLVPKKRVVSLRTGCCSSPKSSGFRGPRMRSGISGSETPSSGRRVTRVVREAA